MFKELFPQDLSKGNTSWMRFINRKGLSSGSATTREEMNVLHEGLSFVFYAQSVVRTRTPSRHKAGLSLTLLSLRECSLCECIYV